MITLIGIHGRRRGLLVAALLAFGSATATGVTTASASSMPPDAAAGLDVDTTLGAVHGAPSAEAAVRAFLTIPYAAPPTQANRWLPPQPHAGWTDPLEATEPGPACPQLPFRLEGVLDIPEGDEDCLTLSVWSAAGAADLPVMVWLHGGSLLTGSAHQPMYNGDQLAGRGAVVVGVNYRLGALGFLATDEMRAADGPAGNFGFLDQVAALEWVRDNIANFGGDPANVTIFGESAGALSVCGHLASVPSAGLFQKAVVQSGGGCGRANPVDDAVVTGAAFQESFGCADLACLRAIPADRLIEPEFNAQILDDGSSITTDARSLAAAGELAGVPILIGSTADEATLFTVGLPEPSDDEIGTRLTAVGADPAVVLPIYPAADFADNSARYNTIYTDIGFVCPTLAFAAAAPDQTYVYHYTHVPESAMAALGATHGSELVPLFGHPEGLPVLGTDTLPSPTQAVSDTLQAAWVSFATTGSPGEAWATYGIDGVIAVIGDEQSQTTGAEIRDGRCRQLTDAVGGNWPS